MQEKEFVCIRCPLGCNITVKLEGGELPVVSVKTAGDIPKDKIMECIRTLKAVTLKAPVRVGDVVVKNVCGSGVDVIATRNGE